MPDLTYEPVDENDTTMLPSVKLNGRNDDTRLAPASRHLAFCDLVQSVMNEAQFEVLTGHVPQHAIRYKPKGGKNMPYVPHGYTRDQLNKAFGFDWDYRVLPIFGGMPYMTGTLREGKREYTTLTVCGELTVRIRDPQDVTRVLSTIVKQDFGSLALRDGMEFGDALKGATSDALKRCGLGLGIALDLYYSDADSAAAYALSQRIQKVRDLSEQGQTPVEIASAVGVDVSQVKAWLTG